MIARGNLFQRETAIAVHKFRHVLLVISLVLIFTGAFICCSLSLIVSLGLPANVIVVENAFGLVIGLLGVACLCWCVGCVALRLACQALRTAAKKDSLKCQNKQPDTLERGVSPKRALIEKYNKSLSLEETDEDNPAAVHHMISFSDERRSSVSSTTSSTPDEDTTTSRGSSSKPSPSPPTPLVAKVVGPVLKTAVKQPKSILKGAAKRNTVY